jgi:putative membrane protein
MPCWVTEALGFERDNFDRMALFTVGFYAYPVAEWLWARRLVRSRWLLASVFAIGTVAMTYDLV